MKRYYVLMISLAGILVLGILGTQIVWSKAHVPINHVQVCHEGFTKEVSDTALAGHLEHDDCRLPTCDFNNVFLEGDACTNPGGGFCAPLAPRIPADGLTPACTPAF